MLSASPLSVFSYKVYNIKSEKQIPILPKLMVIKFGMPVLESLTRISNFYDPVIPNINFIKRWLKIGYP